MAKGKKIGISEEFDTFLNDFEIAITEMAQKSHLHKIGTIIKELVKERMRDGYGVKRDGGRKSKYKELAAKTVAMRKKKNLSGLTKPGKSNQIESGKMYDSIRVYSKDNGEVAVGIAPSNDRAEVAQYQEDKGRSTFHLSKVEQDVIADEAAKLIDKTLGKLFKK